MSTEIPAERMLEAFAVIRSAMNEAQKPIVEFMEALKIWYATLPPEFRRQYLIKSTPGPRRPRRNHPQRRKH